MKGNLLENKKLEKGEDGVEASLHWEIRRRAEENSTKVSGGVSLSFCLYVSLASDSSQNSDIEIFFGSNGAYFAISVSTRGLARVQHEIDELSFRHERHLHISPPFRGL